jgi:hypothetical protein
VLELLQQSATLKQALWERALSETVWVMVLTHGAHAEARFLDPCREPLLVYRQRNAAPLLDAESGDQDADTPLLSEQRVSRAAEILHLLYVQHATDSRAADTLVPHMDALVALAYQAHRQRSPVQRLAVPVMEAIVAQCDAPSGAAALSVALAQHSLDVGAHVRRGRVGAAIAALFPSTCSRP